MLKYEDIVAEYLKSTNHHIRYQVEPVFRGNELVARGVHMQGKSVEDGGVEFNVYIFNVEEGVTINYTDGTSKLNPGTVVNNPTNSNSNTSSNKTSPSTTIYGEHLTVHDGQQASVTVKTTPNAKGTIEVDYASGPSHASGLEPKTADSKGYISWSWEVGTRTKPGTYDVIITVNGQTITKHLIVQ
jgi:P2-related tail formation protein